MHRVALVLGLVGSLSAQEVPSVPEPVEQLPGAGRPIDIAATAARRARLMDRLGDALIVVPAAAQRDLESDVLQDNDFRQDDYFFYLTGLESPDAWLVMAAQRDEADAAFLLLPARNPRGERWTGRRLGPGEDAERLTGVPATLPASSLDSLIAALSAQVGEPLYMPLSGTARVRDLAGGAASPRTVVDVVPVLDSLRLVKDQAELTRMRRAIAITVEAHKAVMREARPGMYEYQLEAVVEYTFRDLGADRVGFPSIVGSGLNGTTLHYDVNRRRTEPGDLVVVDIGAEYGQYSADVTRTFPVDGTFTPRQRAIYELVLAAQRAAIAAVRPGTTIGALNRVARKYIRDHSGDLCGDRTCDAYFIHGLSHWLGMRVHDVGDYGAPLVPGMVLTIEPGIYLPSEALGVRIEDDVLVTEDGAEILSAGAPRTVEAIEALMRGRSPR